MHRAKKFTAGMNIKLQRQYQGLDLLKINIKEYL